MYKENNNIHQFIDIHSHILPNINGDDWSTSMAMSIEYLKAAKAQGAKAIFCTPHCFGDMVNFKNDVTTLANFARREGIDIQLYAGSEMHDHGTLSKKIMGTIVSSLIPSLNGGYYHLVEFSQTIEPYQILESARKLREEAKVGVIIAHIERYYKLAKDFETLIKLKNMGCLFQINAFSLVGETNPNIKNFARKLVEYKMADFIGSDAHRTNHRPYYMKPGVDYIYHFCDKEYADKICYRNALDMLIEAPMRGLTLEEVMNRVKKIEISHTHCMFDSYEITYFHTNKEHIKYTKSISRGIEKKEPLSDIEWREVCRYLFVRQRILDWQEPKKDHIPCMDESQWNVSIFFENGDVKETYGYGDLTSGCISIKQYLKGM